ncbi:dynamin GTPase [Aureobasidium pullulans]|uniref:Dynamin GTPase n=1 Tax=Aureobasidium pullulans TaxID=5580 RepID=A0A4S9V978_AURPU|nr:dynamin GTPase [Aureobasidium pullulans]THZ48294.1 dynamin GTPase [Aureobasidium pullulans]THZ67993.1 dynamin GTPase [Aureobasidium pullulans]
MHQDSASMTSNMVDPGLLEKIDKLFACGVGEQIPLPQLVVVGDQSSGKSSVLEGITKLPFPRDSGLCTRFATQITFRRAETTTTTVTIIPHTGAAQDYADRLTAWKNVTHAALEPVSFSKTMKEVHKLMDLADSPADSDGKSTFSEDILKVEVTGPKQEHFSVVDVPGIFRTATKGLTTLGDADMVKRMVGRYMDNPRSVMLVVIPANVDIATQEILTLAEKADPEGHRTLGVLTKPDLVDPGAEAGIMDLIKGVRHPLNLGWCIVRNLGQQQIQDTAADRSNIEKTFFRDRAPWNELDPDRVGVDALRNRLQEVLASNIRREFVNVKMELQQKLKVANQALERLGAKRQTPEEQRAFMLDISMRFQEIVNMALSSSYSNSDCFDKTPSLMFVTTVVNRNEDFSNAIDRYGHSYEFEKCPSIEESDVKENSFWQLEKKDSGTKVEVQLRSTKNHPDLQDLIDGEHTLEDKVGDNIIGWLTNLYRESRGYELGTFDKNLLSKTMKAQSLKWDLLAKGYILDVIHMAHTFVEDLLHELCDDKRVRDGIMNILMEPLLEKYVKVLKHTEFLLFVERSSTPITLNKYFNANLEKSRQDRLQKTLEEKAWATDSADKGPAVLVKDLIQQHSGMSNSKHTVFELHDILKSYYKVARKRFVDCVCSQGADYHLVAGPESPLKLFSPRFVGNLTAEQLETIAGEDYALKRKRMVLMKQVAALQVGKNILLGVS